MPSDRLRNNELHQGILTRLLHDRRGNVIAITAAMIFPLIGLVGGGIDISRLYIAKARLQHACDAGALAGRKAMGGGVWGQNGSLPRKVALQFFDGNYQADAYGGNSLARDFNEVSGKVTGTASVAIPMTLMKIFSKPTQTLQVACEADMQLPNTDIMFVLDVTGSMADKAVSTDTETKIQGLRTAVKCFYETVARLDISDADCIGGAPSGGTGNQVQVRFGFMPYSINVNVGKLLPSNWFPDSWTYQSRSYDRDAWGDWTAYGSERVASDASCRPAYANTATREFRFNRRADNVCYYDSRDLKTFWNYGPTVVPFSGMKDGSSWKTKTEIQLRIGDNGVMRTITWNGCIEERETVQASSYSPIPAGAIDLDIDAVPTSDIKTQWKPSLDRVIYLRRATSNTTNYDTATINSSDNYRNDPGYSCPAQASKLVTWSDPDKFRDYVNSLQPTGNTYHDIGMLWGARFMSSTGIFAAENAKTNRQGDIARHMIYMTDGSAQSFPCDYTAYGVPFFDKRTTIDTGTGADCRNSRTALNNQINLRLEALCTAVKNKSITLWVISFGSGSDADTESRLARCASPNRYFTARDSATLQTKFHEIADQITALRLTS